MTTPAVEFLGVGRHFGTVRAVDDVSFAVAAGEFFSMLGPSGSGKTTCLRMIAGFETPDSGAIRVGGHDMTGVPPYERDVNTVFQDYALFPHMTVADNVAYGLMVKGVDRPTRRRRALEALDLVKLEGLQARRPAQLSGGQRQRVALARALVKQPRVLLLDEPLGALDLKLREQMQVELKALQRHLGITFVYVTHDQAEALSMSDRLAVFNHGRVEQIGSPEAVYENPETAFVAGFVGVSNIVDGARAARFDAQADAIAIRPEKLLVAARGGAEPIDGHRAADGVVTEIQYHGSSTRYQVTLDDGVTLNVTVPNRDLSRRLAADQPVTLYWRPEDVHRLRGTSP